MKHLCIHISVLIYIYIYIYLFIGLFIYIYLFMIILILFFLGGGPGITALCPILHDDETRNPEAFLILNLI